MTTAAATTDPSIAAEVMSAQKVVEHVGAPLRLLVVVLVAGVALSACSDSSESASPTATGSESLEAVPTTITASIAASAEVATAGSDDASVAIDALVAQLGGAYEFSSITTLGELEALRIEGRRHNGATELSISSGGVLVEYVISENGETWVRQDGDESWSEDDSLDSGDPLDQLGRPAAVRFVGETPDALLYRADYEPSALGLPPGDLLSVDVASRPGRIEFRYELDAVSVVVTISAEIGGPTITVPAAEST